MAIVHVKLEAIFVLIMTIVFNLFAFSHSTQIQSEFGTTNDGDNQANYCSNDSMCPTWFVCNPENSCRCGNIRNSGVLCDSRRLKSAALECKCAL